MDSEFIKDRDAGLLYAKTSQPGPSCEAGLGIQEPFPIHPIWESQLPAHREEFNSLSRPDYSALKQDHVFG